MVGLEAQGGHSIPVSVDPSDSVGVLAAELGAKLGLSPSHLQLCDGQGSALGCQTAGMAQCSLEHTEFGTKSCELGKGFFHGL